MIAAFVQSLAGASPIQLHQDHAPDNPSSTRLAAERALSRSDLVLTTGGVGVSAHDLLASTWGQLGLVSVLLGVRIQRLALGWHAWELSESALVVGLVAGAQFLPLVILTPFFGVFVDRLNTRVAAIAMHIILVVITGVLGGLTLTDNITPALLVVLALFYGVANSAYSPVRLALIPNLVTKKQLPSAVAISSMVFNGSRFIGPGIAGGIVAFYGLGYAYLINMVSYLPVIVVLSSLRIGIREEDRITGNSYFADLIEGLRYTRDHAPIRQVLLLAGVANFFGRGILELMPAFAALLFSGGSGVLAILMAAAGVGSLIATLIYSTRASQVRLHGLVVAGAIGAAISMVTFAYADTLFAGVISVTLLGLCGSLVAIGSQTEVQLQVENRLRGRVMSLWTLVIMGGPALGSVVCWFCLLVPVNRRRIERRQSAWTIPQAIPSSGATE